MGKLTNTAVKAALNKVGRYTDGDGLCFVVRSSGRASWVARLQKNGKRRDFGLGSYPAVGLATAREKASEMRTDLAAGRDPLIERRKANGVPTFKTAAEFVHAARKKDWRNGKHVDQWINSLRDHVFPSIGAMRLDHITMGDVIGALAEVWQAHPDTGSKVLQRVRAVLDWGFSQGHRTAETPMRTIMLGLPKRVQVVRHHPAMPYAEVPAFMTELDKHTNMSRLALAFVILTAARSGEARGATWSEIDFDKALWTIPAARMKMKRDHVVPLAPSAMAIITTVKQFRTPASEYVFPGLKAGKPLSDMTLTAFMRKKGLPFTAHGFRSSFRDWVSETTDFAGDVAELALAHSIASKTERAYRRGSLLDKRRVMMEAWATFCAGEVAPAHG